MTVAFKTEIETAVSSLARKDGVIVVPTDTTYGVICRLDFPDAIERIYGLKDRDRAKPLIILGSDPGLLMQWVTGDLTMALALASRFWPGPLTIVARATEMVPPGILAGGRTVGLRMPRHFATLELLSRLPRRSVASTSANISGAGAPKRIEEVLGAIGELVDYVLPDCDEEPAGCESTIVDVSASEPKVLRVGALSEESIMTALSGVARH